MEREGMPRSKAIKVYFPEQPPEWQFKEEDAWLLKIKCPGKKLTDFDFSDERHRLAFWFLYELAARHARVKDENDEVAEENNSIFHMLLKKAKGNVPALEESQTRKIIFYGIQETSLYKTCRELSVEMLAGKLDHKEFLVIPRGKGLRFVHPNDDKVKVEYHFGDSQEPFANAGLTEKEIEAGKQKGKKAESHEKQSPDTNLLPEFLKKSNEIVSAMLDYRIGANEDQAFSYIEDRQFNKVRYCPDTQDITFMETESLSALQREERIKDIEKFIFTNPAATKIFILTGEGGVGKSSFLLWLNKKILESHGNSTSQMHELVPVYVPCHILKNNWYDDIANYLTVKEQEQSEEYGLDKKLRFPFPYFPDATSAEQAKQFLKDNRKRLVLLLDGYNEQHHERFVGKMKAFPAHAKIIASREEGVNDFRNYPSQDIAVMELVELERKDVIRLLEEHKIETEGVAKENIGWLQNPLLLRLCIQGHIQITEARSEYEFLERMFEKTLAREEDRWARIKKKLSEGRKPQVPLSEIFKMLPELSFRALVDGQARVIDREKLRQYCRAISDHEDVTYSMEDIFRSFQAYDCVWGLFEFNEEHVEFYHQRFQEYFVAKYVISNHSDIGIFIKLFGGGRAFLGIILLLKDHATDTSNAADVELIVKMVMGWLKYYITNAHQIEVSLISLLSIATLLYSMGKILTHQKLIPDSLSLEVTNVARTALTTFSNIVHTAYGDNGSARNLS